MSTEEPEDGTTNTTYTTYSTQEYVPPRVVIDKSLAVAPAREYAIIPTPCILYRVSSDASGNVSWPFVSDILLNLNQNYEAMIPMSGELTSVSFKKTHNDSSTLKSVITRNEDDFKKEIANTVTETTVVVLQKANSSTVTIHLINKSKENLTKVYLEKAMYVPYTAFGPTIYMSKQAAKSAFESISTDISDAIDLMWGNGATRARILCYTDSTKSEYSKYRLQQVLKTMRLLNDISYIVPVNVQATHTSSGSIDLLATTETENHSDLIAINDEIEWRNQNELECRGIFGISKTPMITTGEAISLAKAMNSIYTMFVPSGSVNFNAVWNSVVNDAEMHTDSWRYACAMAGKASALSDFESLTRKVLVGNMISPVESYEDKNTMAKGRCTLVEEKNNNLVVRHSILTYQEMQLDWSYSGAYNYIIQKLRAKLEPFIGVPSTDVAVGNIYATVNALLMNLTDTQQIVSYDDLEVNRQPDNPEIVNVTFRYAWARPINWIYVKFNVDMTY